MASQYQHTLRAADLRTAAAMARIPDASRGPNPTIGATGENFGGDLGPDHLESTLEISQVLELGGDRGARHNVASEEAHLAAADAAMLRRDLLVLTAERFIQAWSVQERLTKLREGEALTTQAIQAASARHRAGASPLFEQSRAEAQALMQAVERRRAESDLVIARRDLAQSWGSREASFDSLVLEPGDGQEIVRQPPPDLERASAAERVASARLRAARASQVPDLAVSGGVRHLAEARGTGFLVGLEVPLPLWNRQAGTVEAARREQEAAVADRKTTELRLATEFANATERVQAAQAAYETLTSRVRPARQGLLTELLRAYRAGRISYLDLIAEQRSLIETDLAVVDAQADVWRSRTRLRLLTGSEPSSGGGR